MSARNTSVPGAALVVAALLLWLAIFPDAAEARPEPPVRSCGQSLIVRLRRLCDGKYNNAVHSRLRRGIVDDCCRSLCLDTHVKKYYCGPPSEQPEASPEDLELPESAAVFKFHFGTVYSATTAAKEEKRVEEKPEAGSKSKVVIGRVPQDYVRAWTYTG